jgi:hypothetical protein
MIIYAIAVKQQEKEHVVVDGPKAVDATLRGRLRFFARRAGWRLEGVKSLHVECHHVIINLLSFLLLMQSTRV